MKAKLNRGLAAILLLALALTGCRTSRQAESAAALSRRQQAERIAPLAQYPTDILAVSAKTAITLDYNGYPLTVKGRLRMRHDESIQMSLIALGLMEIASVEFTPQRAYIIDRINKRYAQFDYSSGWANLAGVNFNAVQALFWNRIFIPGEKAAWNKAEDFTITNTGAHCLIEPSRKRMLKCQFYTDTDYKQLQQTDLNLQQYAATWRYGQFDAIGTYTYPTTHDVSVSGSTHTMGARIMLTEISTLDTGWKSSTDLSRYKEVDLEQILSILEMIR